VCRFPHRRDGSEAASEMTPACRPVGLEGTRVLMTAPHATP
jgi:hypothetical protein